MQGEGLELFIKPRLRGECFIIITCVVALGGATGKWPGEGNQKGTSQFLALPGRRDFMKTL